jgi:hypothetical protein
MTTQTLTALTGVRAYPELVKPPTAADREARYTAALKLVERIEKNLSCSRRCLYWRISDKAQLTTVMEVVNAILADDLLLPNEPMLNAN